MAKGILLEAGTNEMELLVFRLKDTAFGINVAKVREVIQRPETVTIPHAPWQIEGSFRLREDVLTLINIGRHFDMEGKPCQDGDGMIIIVEFDQVRCGILVDAVEVIHRLNWEKIEPPSVFLTELNVPITGITRVNDETILIADFEAIVGDILGVGIANLADVEGEPVASEDIRIILADDSSLLRSSLKKILTQGGYTDLTICCDGQELWDRLEAGRGNEEAGFDLVLTDVEMPRMDGLHLTSKIKHDPDFGNLPVVLFSSLITEDNRRKGEAVGADAQVSKPDSSGLVNAVTSCLAKVGKVVTEAELV